MSVLLDFISLTKTFLLAFSIIHQGLIEFKNMTLYYDVNSAPALKNLNLTIEPGMKVGIVGRFVDAFFHPALFFHVDLPSWKLHYYFNDVRCTP